MLFSHRKATALGLGVTILAMLIQSLVGASVTVADTGSRPAGDLVGWYHPAIQKELSGGESWLAFRNTYGGNWKVLWNEVTGTPAMVYGGSGVVLSGPVREGNLESLARGFLLQNAPLFGIPKSVELRVSHLKRGAGKWYVCFEECHRGIVVDGASAGLVVFDSGNVEAFYLSLFSGITVSPVASVEMEQACQAAKSLVSFDETTDRIARCTLVVYPWVTDGRPVFHLSWKIYLSCTGTLRDWLCFVDAQSGSVLSCRDITIKSDRVYGRVQGYFFPNYGPRDESPEFEPCIAESVRVYTQSDSLVARGITGSDGSYSLDVPSAGNYKVEFFLKGTDFVIWNRDRTSLGDYIVLADTVQGSTSDSTNWEWDYDNPNVYPRYEVNTFHHVRDMRRWIADFPIAFQEGELDYFAKAKVNAWPYSPYPFCCNGQYNRDSSLVRLTWGNTDRPQGAPACEAGDCENMGYYSDCINHEMAHGFILHVHAFDMGYDYQYAMSEGLADYFAASKTDDPVHGEVSRPSCLVRYVSNDLTLQGDWSNTCPEPPCRPGEDLCPDPNHYRGQILSGAIWDFRSSVNATCADTLVYKSLRDTSAIDFELFAHRMILEDDDDQTLSNRTPHYQQLATAFSKHGIYSPGPPQDLVATADTHSVRLDWDPPQHEYGLEGYKVYYSMTSRGSGNYAAGTACVVAGDTTSWTLSCLQAGASYCFSVVTYDGNDDDAIGLKLRVEPCDDWGEPHRPTSFQGSRPRSMSTLFRGEVNTSEGRSSDDAVHKKSLT